MWHTADITNGRTGERDQHIRHRHVDLRLFFARGHEPGDPASLHGAWPQPSFNG
jgi:hypothetical protein